MSHFSGPDDSSHDSDKDDQKEMRVLQNLGDRISNAINEGTPSLGTRLPNAVHPICNLLGKLMAEVVVGKTPELLSFAKMIANSFRSLLDDLMFCNYNEERKRLIFDSVATYMRVKNIETDPTAIALNAIWIKFAVSLTTQEFLDILKECNCSIPNFQDLVSMTRYGGNPYMECLGDVLRGIQDFMGACRNIIMMIWIKKIQSPVSLSNDMIRILDLLVYICHFLRMTFSVFTQFVDYYPSLRKTRFVSSAICACIRDLNPLMKKQMHAFSRFSEEVVEFSNILKQNAWCIVETNHADGMEEAYEEYDAYATALRPDTTASNRDTVFIREPSDSDAEADEGEGVDGGGDGDGDGDGGGGGGSTTRGRGHGRGVSRVSGRGKGVSVRTRGQVRGRGRARGRGRGSALLSSSENLESGHSSRCSTPQDGDPFPPAAPRARIEEDTEDDDDLRPPSSAAKKPRRRKDAASAAAAAGSPEVAKSSSAKKPAVKRTPRKPKDPSAIPLSIPKTPRKSRAVVNIDLAEAVSLQGSGKKKLTRLDRELASSAGYVAATKSAVPTSLKVLPVAVAVRLPSGDVGENQSDEDYDFQEGAGGGAGAGGGGDDDPTEDDDPE